MSDDISHVYWQTYYPTKPKNPYCWVSKDLHQHPLCINNPTAYLIRIITIAAYLRTSPSGPFFKWLLFSLEY